MPAEAWGAMASVLVALIGLAGLMYKELRSQGKVTRATAEQLDGNGTTVSKRLEHVDMQLRAFRVDNEKAHSVLLSHVADLQRRQAENRAELDRLGGELHAHMMEEMGDEGSYATVLSSVNEIHEQILRIQPLIDATVAFMTGYKDSKLPNTAAVNEWVDKVAALESEMDAVEDRLHDLEHEVE